MDIQSSFASASATFVMMASESCSWSGRSQGLWPATADGKRASWPSSSRPFARLVWSSAARPAAKTR